MPNRFVIELDSMLQELDGQILRPIRDLAEIHADTWLITDFQNAVTQVMHIDAPPKYAEAVIRKKLQDSGEFEEAIHIIIHWKRRRGRGASEVYFTAVPISRYLHYQDQSQAHPNNLLVFPLHSLLWNVLKGLHSRQPTAVIFAHDRFVDLVAGNHIQVSSATRLTAFSTEEDALRTLWESVERELELISHGGHLRIKQLLGFQWQGDEQAFSRNIAGAAEHMDAEWLMLPAEELKLGEHSYLESLPHALKTLRSSQSISPPADRLRYQGQRLAPWAAMAALGANLALGAGAVWYNQQSAELGEIVGQREAKVHSYPVASVGDVPPYQDRLVFAQELSRLRATPSYREILNGVSLALGTDMVVETVTVTHGEGKITLLLVGNLSSSFHRAQSSHQDFLTILRRQGYIILEQQFATDINKSNFMLKLVLHQGDKLDLKDHLDGVPKRGEMG